MAEEYEFTPDGKGGGTFRPKNHIGCGTIIGIIVFFIIIGICLQFCDDSSDSNYSADNNSTNATYGENNNDVNTIPDICGIESLHILSETGFPRFYTESIENAYGIMYPGPYLSLWGANIENPHGEGYTSNIELVTGKHYRYFSGTFFADPKQNDNQTIQLLIYADDELVYSSEIIDRRTQPIEFTINIQNCNVLRIETVTNDYYLATGNPSRINIVNATVSK